MNTQNGKNTILQDFKKNRENLEKIEKIASEKINALVKEKKLFVMEVSHRIKEENSLAEKLKRKKNKYNSMYEITDLLGVRIICYLQDTVDAISAAIPQIFDVDEKNSMDKRQLYDDNQFGYLSIHYICSLKKEDADCSNTENKTSLSDIRFEIQIRTVLQHAWAEIEHDLGYKSRFGIPHPIRREFSRIAGLLELADQEFVNLRTQTNNYISEIKQKIAQGNAEELPLDRITLQEFIQTNIAFNEYVSSMCEQLKCEYIPSPADKYLPDLDWLGVKKLADFIKLFKDNKEIACKILQTQVSELELDMLTTSMILRDICHAELIRSGYNREQIMRYMKLSTENDEAALRHTERLMTLLHNLS